MTFKTIHVQEDYNAGSLPEMWNNIYKATSSDDAFNFLNVVVDFNSIRHNRKFRIIESTHEVIHELETNNATNI